MIRRDIEERLKMMATKMPIISITGPRQSGKTTLAKKCFSSYSYVNLENPDTLADAQSDPRLFLSRHTNGLIIDEVHCFLNYFLISKRLAMRTIELESSYSQDRKISYCRLKYRKVWRVEFLLHTCYHSVAVNWGNSILLKIHQYRYIKDFIREFIIMKFLLNYFTLHIFRHIQKEMCGKLSM